jgi:hypothetical protein
LIFCFLAEGKPVFSFQCSLRYYSYTQEIPSRFKKDIVRAAKHDETDRIALEGMQRVITNINMEHMITRQDMETIFREIGGETKMIPADRFMKII